jgi:two-component system LytT family response regulator
MSIRTLIVDDEPLARNLVRRLLARDPDFSAAGECGDPREVVALVEKEKPDLIILDVQMPELSGFEALSLLAPEQLPIVIFVTAHEQFALQAFSAHAVDFLLKPIDEERFDQALKKAKVYLSGHQNGEMRERLQSLLEQVPTGSRFLSRLAVRSGERVVILKTEEVDWIEAAGNYLNLHVGKAAYMIRGRINALEMKLDPERFFRIHRSTMVNLDRVREFQPLFKGEGVVVLKDGIKLPASRSCSQRLQSLLAPPL